MSPSPSHDALTWVPAMLRLKPARLPIGHSLRSGITVGAPFVIGVLTGHVLIGMWIGLATLLLSAGEREGSHRLNLRILLISTPIAASAYLLGFIQHLPTAWLVLVMAALAFGQGSSPATAPRSRWVECSSCSWPRLRSAFLASTTGGSQSGGTSWVPRSTPR